MNTPVELVTLPWPEFGSGDRPAPASAAELSERIERTRRAMHAAGWSHLAVYGDREHFANLCWLTGFDPRFEEALLILGLDGDPLLLVGNECVSYVKISPLVAAGALRYERHPPFSLPDQPATGGRELEEILAAEQLGPTGLVDWKILGGAGGIAMPHWIATAIFGAAPQAGPATALLHRLRECASAAEIAFFEWTNTLAADGVRRMLESVPEAAATGWTDFELMTRAGYGGEPQGCHWGLKTAGHRISLASPNGSRVARGGPLSMNVCYRGANVCRAGWVAQEEAELPAEARGYVADFAAPYFAACAEWLEALGCGASAGEMTARMAERLPFERFGIFLNPGHLIHLEEWLSSPFQPGSGIHLESGMVVQSDIIPGAPRYFSTRLEDGYALVDEALATELTSRFPGVAARCQARRGFLREELGIRLRPDVWALSNLAGWLPPFFLNPDRVFVYRR